MAMAMASSSTFALATTNLARSSFEGHGSNSVRLPVLSLATPMATTTTTSLTCFESHSGFDKKVKAPKGANDVASPLMWVKAGPFGTFGKRAKEAESPPMWVNAGPFGTFGKRAKKAESLMGMDDDGLTNGFVKGVKEDEIVIVIQGFFGSIENGDNDKDVESSMWVKAGPFGTFGKGAKEVTENHFN